MNEIRNLEGFGLVLPSPLYIAGAVLFGIIGYIASLVSGERGSDLMQTQ